MRRHNALDTCIRIACDADRRIRNMGKWKLDELSKAMTIQSVAVDGTKLINKKEIKWL